MSGAEPYGQIRRATLQIVQMVAAVGDVGSAGLLGAESGRIGDRAAARRFLRRWSETATAPERPR